MIDSLLSFDKYFFTLINLELSNRVLDWMCPIIRNQSTWYPLYLLLIYFTIKHYKFESWKIILGIALMVLCSDQLSSHLIKPWVMRLRPCCEPLLRGKIHHLIESCNGYSFVSAHAANHFALAYFFVHLFHYANSRWLTLFYFWAFAIAFSQVYVGVHYPLDVFCGAILGLIIGRIFYFLSFLFVGSNIKSATEEL